jgi:hypothetical protein
VANNAPANAIARMFITFSPFFFRLPTPAVTQQTRFGLDNLSKPLLRRVELSPRYIHPRGLLDTVGVAYVVLLCL